MTSVSLADIVFDAGTQIRAAISEAVISEYAEAMTNGAQFPPVVLFFDSTRYYMADGFHRAQAATRIGLTAIPADVRLGTKDDALWFALGANKANGHRMTEQDKQHAVAIALKRWPERMQREIAEQIGCHPSLVSKVYQKTTASEPVLRGRELVTHQKREAVKQLIAEGGHDSTEIAQLAKVSRSLVTDVRAEMGLSKVDKSRSAVAQRRKDIAVMAARGFSSRQIADAVGLDEITVRSTARTEGIVIHADRIVGKTKHHDANRIVERMVLDGESLCADVDLIEFADLDRAQLDPWITSLRASRKALSAFITRLEQEQKKHGEAA